jgi:DNA-binding GntR family transcriptional regulator
MSFSHLPVDGLDRRPAPLRRQLVAALGAAIANGSLRPGARLVETALCDRFGVSRTVLREALRELEAAGLAVQGARGLVVGHIDRAEAENVYAVRGALEALLAREFCLRARPTDRTAVREALERLHRAADAADAAAALAAKEAFYDALGRGSGNPVAVALLGRLRARTALLRSRSMARPGRLAAAIRELDRLTDALVARDGVAAAALAVAHVEAAALAAFDGEDDPDRPANPMNPEISQ